MTAEVKGLDLVIRNGLAIVRNESSYDERVPFASAADLLNTVTRYSVNVRIRSLSNPTSTEWEFDPNHEGMVLFSDGLVIDRGCDAASLQAFQAGNNPYYLARLKAFMSGSMLDLEYRSVRKRD